MKKLSTILLILFPLLALAQDYEYACPSPGKDTLYLKEGPMAEVFIKVWDLLDEEDCPIFKIEKSLERHRLRYLRWEARSRKTFSLRVQDI
jgi:hypothetical protein